MKDNIIEMFDSLSFLKLESEGTFGRHYRFSETRYKVILYTKHSDCERGWRVSYHKQVEWSNNSSNLIYGWFNSSFQEVFEGVEPELREKILWHLDLFR